jgi:integrase
MSGYEVFQKKNGSGKVSPFYRVRFTLDGKQVSFPTGERDGAAADRVGAQIYLTHHQQAGKPVPEGTVDAEDITLVRVGAILLVALEDELARGDIKRGPRFVKDVRFDIRGIQTKFQTITQLTGPEWTKAVKEWHAGYPDRKEALSWRYLQRWTITARALTRHAKLLGLIDVVPTLVAPSNEQVKNEEAHRRAYSLDERDLFLATVAEMAKDSPRGKRKGRRAYRAFLVLFTTGLRKSALERMRVRQINWDTGFVVLPAGTMKKRNRDREIWLRPETKQAILEELEEVRADLGRDLLPSDFVFGEMDLRYWFRSAIRKAGIDPRGLTAHHATRHTLATQLGDADATLAQMLNTFHWETPTMPARYMHDNAQLAKAALERLPPPVLPLPQSKASVAGEPVSVRLDAAPESGRNLPNQTT